MAFFWVTSPQKTFAKANCVAPRVLLKTLNTLYKHRPHSRLAVSVYCQGQWLINQTWGPASDPITVDTPFFIGSLSKSFTAARVLKALHKNENLDLPVGYFWPDFNFAGHKDVSFAHLLSHDSGILRHELMWYKRNRTHQALYRGIQFLDGQSVGFHYSNLNYFVADYALSKITGELQTEKNTPMYAALGMKASLTEMNDWLSMQFNVADLQVQHQPRVLLNNSLIGKRPLQNLSYGLGWFAAHYRGQRFVFHGGRVPEGTSLMAFLPDDNVGLVVLSSAPSSQLSQAIAYSLLDQLVDVPPNALANNPLRQDPWRYFANSTPKRVVPQAVYKPQDLSKYVGTYRHVAYGEIAIGVKNQQLFLDLGKKRYVLKAIKPRVFEVLAIYPDLKRLVVTFGSCEKETPCHVDILTEPESGKLTRFVDIL